MEIGSVQLVDIDHQMRSAYLDYAMSVIVSRALPDARDGLKPVHRRILYAMYDMGLRSDSAYRKSARIVGDVLGKYHPHGDAAVYASMVRMAQDFSMRYCLVDGQGNFGSIDGDEAAAMRYTEARLHAIAEELLRDIDKDTVDFVANFDGSLQEPSVLPARLPNLLLNGASGIAVGMATNIPPHNLRELVAGLIYLIDHYHEVEEVTPDDLMQHIPGPDFPTRGVIIGLDGIRQAYSTGRGSILLRGKAHIEETGGNRSRIIITEIPFQVNKTTLIERIAELVRSEKLEDISDLRDESDQQGMSIVIELKRGANPQKTLNQLYKYTALQSTIGVQMLALVNGQPRLLPLKRALQVFLEHRIEVVNRRSRYELEKARARSHILDGLLIALAHLDEIIQTIRQSPDADVAKERLMQRFKLSELQAQAILDMQLRRLAALERQKIEAEQQQLLERIAYLEALLADPQKVLMVIRDELIELADKYGDERRTRITVEAGVDFNEEDLIENKAVLISFTQRGYLKRVDAEAYRVRSRGGRGVQAHTTREEDEVVLLLPAHNLDTLLCFSDQGKVYSTRVYQIPESDRAGRGVSVHNLLDLGDGEIITTAVAVSDFTAAFCVMATLNGRVKRIELSEFAAVRRAGLVAINLEEGDLLGWVRLTRGNDDLILVSEQGQALRFSEKLVRAMGRTATGVSGIKLRSGDRLASVEVVEPDGDLLVITAHGYGKRTSLEEYHRQGRAAVGVATINNGALDKIGRIAAARVVQEGDDVMIMSTGGVMLRLQVSTISRQGRATRGVLLMNLQEGDKVASMARIPA